VTQQGRESTSVIVRTPEGQFSGVLAQVLGIGSADRSHALEAYRRVR